MFDDEGIEGFDGVNDARIKRVQESEGEEEDEVTGTKCNGNKFGLFRAAFFYFFNF